MQSFLTMPVVYKEFLLQPVKDVLQLATELKQIILPLQNEFGINNFSYSRKYLDNSHIILTTNPDDWKIAIYGGSRYDQVNLPQENNIAKYIIWDHKYHTSHEKELNNQLEKQLDRYHSMTMLIKQVEYIEKYWFSTTPENDVINHYYEYAADLFYKFKFYFLEQAEAIINIAEQKKMFVPNIEPTFKVTQDFLDKKDRLAKAITIKKLHICNIIGKDIQITNKEVECIKWMMHGKSSLEIAQILNLEKTTINTHLRNIKEKIGLHKGNQLIRFFANIPCIN